jgi:transposase InsO family protein
VIISTHWLAGSGGAIVRRGSETMLGFLGDHDYSKTSRRAWISRLGIIQSMSLSHAIMENFKGHKFVKCTNIGGGVFSKLVNPRGWTRFSPLADLEIHIRWQRYFGSRIN